MFVPGQSGSKSVPLVPSYVPPWFGCSNHTNVVPLISRTPIRSFFCAALSWRLNVRRRVSCFVFSLPSAGHVVGVLEHSQHNFHRRPQAFPGRGGWEKKHPQQVVDRHEVGIGLSGGRQRFALPRLPRERRSIPSPAAPAVRP
jgi:hypothetical protein